MSYVTRFLTGGMGFLVIPFLGLGCAKETPKLKHDIDIRGLWHVHFMHIGKGFKPEGAKDAEELKAWAKENLTPQYLASMAVHDLDAAFISPRDNLPYVVLPIKKSRVDKGIVIHEAKGINGKRWVAFGIGKVEELGEAQFKEALR